MLPNQKLPSKRSLASHLGVSVITVQNAYEQLIDEGYVYSAEKRGYFVTELEALPSPDSGQSQLTRRKTAPFQYEQGILAERAYSNKTEVATGAEDPREDCEAACLKTIINLQDNHIHHELFPFSLWSRLMRKVLQDSKERILSPLPPQGLRELRQSIVSYLKTFRNMLVSPEQVVIGAGTEYLYSLALQLLGKNLHYGVENPGYLKPSRIMSALQVHWSPLTMDGGGIIPQELEEKGINVVLVSPAHHFPTGIIMPIKRRQELLSWARSGSRYIIEDDYDSEFRFTGRPLETLFSLDAGQTDSRCGHVIYLNTFTKTLTPSLRISYMVLPENLAKAFHQNLGFYSCTVSSIEQLTLARFIHEGHYEKHLVRKKNHYRNLRDNLLFHLSKSSLASRISLSGKDTGLHFLMEVNTSVSSPQLQALLKKAGIQVTFLSQYFHDKPKEGRLPVLVVNYSALKKEQIPVLVERLCWVLAAGVQGVRR